MWHYWYWLKTPWSSRHLIVILIVKCREKTISINHQFFFLFNFFFFLHYMYFVCLLIAFFFHYIFFFLLFIPTKKPTIRWLSIKSHFCSSKLFFFFFFIISLIRETRASVLNKWLKSILQLILEMIKKICRNK